MSHSHGQLARESAGVQRTATRCSHQRQRKTEQQAPWLLRGVGSGTCRTRLVMRQRATQDVVRLHFNFRSNLARSSPLVGSSARLRVRSTSLANKSLSVCMRARASIILSILLHVRRLLRERASVLCSHSRCSSCVRLLLHTQSPSCTEPASSSRTSAAVRCSAASLPRSARPWLWRACPPWGTVGLDA